MEGVLPSHLVRSNRNAQRNVIGGSGNMEGYDQASSIGRHPQLALSVILFDVHGVSTTCIRHAVVTFLRTGETHFGREQCWMKSAQVLYDLIRSSSRSASTPRARISSKPKMIMHGSDAAQKLTARRCICVDWGF